MHHQVRHFSVKENYPNVIVFGKKFLKKIPFHIQLQMWFHVENFNKSNCEMNVKFFVSHFFCSYLIRNIFLCSCLLLACLLPRTHLRPFTGQRFLVKVHQLRFVKAFGLLEKKIKRFNTTNLTVWFAKVTFGITFELISGMGNLQGNV